MKTLQNTILGLFLIFSTSLMAQITITETHQDNVCDYPANAWISMDLVSFSGSIDITVSGGVPPYTYEWAAYDDGYISSYYGGNQQEDLSKIKNGTYIVTVTDDNNDTETLSVILSAPLNPAISVDASLENFGWIDSDDDCLGSMTISSTGGIPPYDTYFGFLRYFYQDTILLPTNDTIGLCALYNHSYYSTVVFDNYGCMGVKDSLKADAISSTIINAQNGLCNGRISISEGNNNFDFSWSNSESTSSIYQLCPDSYLVTIIDPTGIRANDFIDTFIVAATFDEYYEFVDTLDATVETCILDNSASIDSAFIFDYHFVNPDSVITNWAIWQDGDSSTINVGLSVTNSGNNLVYLDVICNSKSINVTNTYSFYGMFNATGVGIKEIQENGFSLFPNPAKNDFTIKLDNNKDSYLQILDITGKVIYQKNFKKDLLVETTSFKSGIYFVRIENDNNIITEKIIVE